MGCPLSEANSPRVSWGSPRGQGFTRDTSTTSAGEEGGRGVGVQVISLKSVFNDMSFKDLLIK